MDGDQLVLPIVEIKGKLKKFWYLDAKTFDVKRLDQYRGALEKFDPNTFTVSDKKGKRITVYSSFQCATVASLKAILMQKKEKWDKVSKTMMALNEEIGELIEQIEKLERIEE
jgi:hypothetical protein